MKKIISLVIISVLLCVPAWAGQGMGPGPGCKGYASASCANTASSSDTYTTSVSSMECGKGSGFQYCATQISVSETVFSGYTVYLIKGGSAHTQYICPYLYTDSSNKPGTQVLAGTPRAASTLSDSFANEKFEFPCTSVSTLGGSGNYQIVLKYATDSGCGTATYDGTNYFKWRVGGTGSGYFNISSAGSSWSTYNTTQALYTDYK